MRGGAARPGRDAQSGSGVATMAILPRKTGCLAPMTIGAAVVGEPAVPAIAIRTGMPAAKVSMIEKVRIMISSR